jgi:acylphosphatase
MESQTKIVAKDVRGEIILYQPDNSVQLEVRIEDETVWLTQAQMSVLFGRNRTVIGRHIRNIFSEGELYEKMVCANFAHTTRHGAMKDKVQTIDILSYNLDVIISVGYRVKSQQGIHFRQWANSVLKEYILKGYAINQRFERIEYRVAHTENKIEFFVKTALPPVQGIFYNGQIFDRSHDRFLYIDDTVYHIGASLKDLGLKWFAFSKMNKDSIKLDFDKKTKNIK